MTTAEFWKNYLKDTNQNEENAVYSGELIFENTGAAGKTQLSMVLSGAKTAIFTPLDVIEINLEKVPLAGEVYVVLDGTGEPCCIIELTDVNIIPLNEIPWDLARRDGENENLTDWLGKMKDYIWDEADVCGFELHDDIKVVCEIFKIIYKKEAVNG